jgi:hypothetical protein
MPKTDLTIQNCTFAYRCTQSWEGLEPIAGRENVRHCGECQRRVFFCHTDDELANNVRQGRCVAFARLEALDSRAPRKRERHVTLIGDVAMDYTPTPPEGK